MIDKTYTVEEIYELARYERCSIQVESAYNGKVLCKAYKPEKHTEVSNRSVVSITPKIKVDKDGMFATPYLRVFVSGFEEYEKEKNNDNKKQTNKPY